MDGKNMIKEGQEVTILFISEMTVLKHCFINFVDSWFCFIIFTQPPIDKIKLFRSIFGPFIFCFLKFFLYKIMLFTFHFAVYVQLSTSFTKCVLGSNKS